MNKCPKCRSNNHRILHVSDASANTHGLKSKHVVCCDCGREFNIWDATQEELKKIFGASYHLYQ